MVANEQQMSDQSCDVAIIGAGPSGLAAAAVLREHGVGVTIIDEQARAGGQILHQPPKTFAVERWLPSKLYDRVKAALHAVDEQQGFDWRFQSTVLGIMRPSPYRVQRVRAAAVSGTEQESGGSAAHELWIQGPAGCYLLQAGAVLLAPGCYERPLAFQGWTLPGVMGAGAIQGFVKSQQFVPGNRFVLAGSHPLQLVVAGQLLSAGAEVAAVVFTQRMQRGLLMLRHPLVALRHPRPLLETSQILRRLRRGGVPVIFGHTITRADGAATVESATIAAVDSDGTIDHRKARVLDCDRIGVCHGFLASSELARQAGADMHWKDHAGGWLARHDEWLESSVRRLFVAGEITGVEGAEAALEKGRVAAIGILRSLGHLNDRQARRVAVAARKRLSHLQSFAAVLQQLAQPPASLALRTMSDDTILCRCESIRRDDLQRALAENKHVLSADAAKLLTRAGMGLCQGRMCGDNVARVIADARNVQPDAVGTFQAQAPVKPVPLATILRK